jgi:hypothetical protein
MDPAAHASLCTDAVQLLRLQPTRVLFQRGSALWGAAAVIQKESLVIAVSIMGAAILAGRMRPWLYRQPPDLARLAGDLQPHFKHIARKSDKSSLFALPHAPFGACGQHVMLCLATSENFPWLEAATPSSPANALAPVAAAQWADFMRMEGDSLHGFHSGGVLPPDYDPIDFIKRHLRALGPTDLTTDAGRARYRAFLLAAAERERARVRILNACIGNVGAIAIPAWLADPSLAIEGVLEKAVAQQQDRPGTAPADEPTGSAAAAALPAAKPRRPTHHPTIVPSRMPPASDALPMPPAGDRAAPGPGSPPGGAR